MYLVQVSKFVLNTVKVIFSKTTTSLRAEAPETFDQHVQLNLEILLILDELIAHFISTRPTFYVGTEDS